MRLGIVLDSVAPRIPKEGRMFRALRFAFVPPILLVALSCAHDSSRDAELLSAGVHPAATEDLAIAQFLNTDYLSQFSSPCVELRDGRRIVNATLPDGSYFNVSLGPTPHGGTGTIRVERGSDGRKAVVYSYPLATGEGQEVRYDNGRTHSVTTMTAHDDRNAIVERLGRRVMELPCS
jgi:hypothetical protein